jgi:hypothetical protein
MPEGFYPIDVSVLQYNKKVGLKKESGITKRGCGPGKWRHLLFTREQLGMD